MPKSAPQPPAYAGRPVTAQPITSGPQGSLQQSAMPMARPMPPQAPPQAMPQPPVTIPSHYAVGAQAPGAPRAQKSGAVPPQYGPALAAQMRQSAPPVAAAGQIASRMRTGL